MGREMLNGGVSPFVPKCPVLCPVRSSFVNNVPICPRSGPQEGQKRKNGDKMGHSFQFFRGQMGQRPHLASTPI